MSYIDETRNSSNSKIPYDDIPISRNERHSRHGGRKNAPSFKLFAAFLAFSFLINIALCISTIYFFKNGITKNINIFDNHFSSSTSISSLAVANARWSSVCVAAGGSCNDEGTFFRNTRSQGSGVILSLDIEKKEAYFLTCHHVIDDFENAVYVLAPSSLTPQKVEVVGYSEKYDIAVLKTKNIDFLDGCRDIQTYDSNYLTIGENVFAVGNPLSVGLSVSSGIVSQLNVMVQVEGHSFNSREIQTSAEINPGNSGGGLYNEFGQFVGLVNAKLQTSVSGGTNITVAGLAYAIPGNLALNIARSIIANGGRAKQIDIGVTFTHGNIVTSEQINVGGVIKQVDINEVTVDTISSGSVAKGLLVKGDIITKISYIDKFGNKVTSQMPERVFNKFFFEELSFIILENSNMTFTFKRGRNAAEQTVTVTASYSTYVN